MPPARRCCVAWSTRADPTGGQRRARGAHRRRDGRARVRPRGAAVRPMCCATCRPSCGPVSSTPWLQPDSHHQPRTRLRRRPERDDSRRVARGAGRPAARQAVVSAQRARRPRRPRPRCRSCRSWSTRSGREEASAGAAAPEWLALRGAVHQVLASRGSRIALYDLRETLERLVVSSAGVVPVGAAHHRRSRLPRAAGRGVRARARTGDLVAAAAGVGVPGDHDAREADGAERGGEEGAGEVAGNALVMSPPRLVPLTLEKVRSMTPNHSTHTAAD